MRKPIALIALLLAATAAGAYLGGGSMPDAADRETSSRRAAPTRARTPRHADAATVATGSRAPMSSHDERVTTFLANNPLDDDLEGQLVALAETQRAAFAPRGPDDPRETPEQRQARRDRRAEFREQLRDVLAAMPDNTRAALRRHRVNPVLLARAVEAAN